MSAINRNTMDPKTCEIPRNWKLYHPFSIRISGHSLCLYFVLEKGRKFSLENIFVSVWSVSCKDGVVFEEFSPTRRACGLTLARIFYILSRNEEYWLDQRSPFFKRLRESFDIGSVEYQDESMNFRDILCQIAVKFYEFCFSHNFWNPNLSLSLPSSEYSFHLEEFKALRVERGGLQLCV